MSDAQTQIPVENNAAFIKYNGAWEKGDTQSTATQSGDSAQTTFRGEAVTVNGGLGGDTSGRRSGGTGKITVSFDGGEPICITGSGGGQGPLYTNTTLKPGVVHTIDIALLEGVFNFDSLLWNTSDVYHPPKVVEVDSDSGPLYTTEGNWAPLEGLGHARKRICTDESGSKITFKFKGNAVLIKGTGSNVGDGATFDVCVDDKSTEKDLSAYASNNTLIDLYRNDDLCDGDHTVTLTKTCPSGIQFCVSEAEIYDVTRATQSPYKMTRRSLLTESRSLGPLLSGNTTRETITGGGITGIAIVALLIPAFLIAAGLFLRQRRRGDRSNKRGRSDDCATDVYMDEK